MDVFAANDLAAWNLESGSPTESTGRTDTTYTPKGIVVAGSIISPQFINPATGATVALTDCWLHFETFAGGGSFSLVELVNTSGVSVFRIFQPGQNIVRAEYWNGSSWVQTGTSFSLGTNGPITVDVHVVAGAGGSYNFYCQNTLIGTVSGLNAAVNNFAYVRAVNAFFELSQVLVSDQSTIGAKVVTLSLNSNSAVNTAWANDYTNVEKTGWNDTTFISSSTLGDSETYGASDISATLSAASWQVSSLFFAIRARLNSASPANIKPLLRIGGVNYAGAYNFAAGLNSASFSAALAGFAVDPSTSSAFTFANLNAAEYGFQTAA